jgi:PIN domain nuclease of toxin-antitoxin system
MEEIAISKCKATCRAVLENVRKTGKAILVTRFGEPMAEVVPPHASGKAPHWVGSIGGNGSKNPPNELWLSPISLWEVPTLCQKNSLTLHPNPQSWIANALDLVPMREAPITYQVAQEAARVQFPHRDPADRFLVATARVFGPTLVTADEQLLRPASRQSPVLANR